MKGGHKSHVSSKTAKARGWSRVPSIEARHETWNLIQEAQCNYMAQYGKVTLNSQSICGSSDGSNGITTTSGTWDDSGNTFHYWSGDWLANSPEYFLINPAPAEVREIIKEKVVTKEVSMRTLWEVYVVDPRKGGKVLAACIGKDAIVAENENQAMLKAGVAQVAAEAGREIEQVDVYVSKVGTFIRPLKETQRVKIAKSDEDD